MENVSKGLRFTGYADEIAKKGHRRAIDHKGYYIDEYCQETYRGVVYQLPSRIVARKRLCQFVYGFEDPNDSFSALLVFTDPKDDPLEAALAADRFAEIFAEHERDYQAACNARNQVNDFQEEIKATRTQALTLAAEMKRARKTIQTPMPTICATLRAEILSLYREIQGKRKNIKELINDFGGMEGFRE